MDQPNYRVLLEGRMIGPYDRQTIVGMRVKHTLSNDHLLVGSDGVQLTVRQLIGVEPRPVAFQPTRSGVFTRVQAVYSASLIETSGGVAIPRFRGAVEVRVHEDVLRIAGRYRRVFGWKEDRVKLTLKDIVHARVRGSRVDLWLRTGDSAALQRIALGLPTVEAAGELVEWVPAAQPFPDQQPGARPAAGTPLSTASVLAIAVVGITLVVGLVLLVLVSRRVY